MRIRSGHKPEDWIECPPANPGSMPIRGQLVVGVSFKGPNRKDRKRTVTAIKERLERKAPAPRGTVYATDEERLEARRAAFRESKRRARARVKRYNVHDGSGVQSHSMSSDLRRAATTRGPEVAASIEVVAR